MPCSVLAYFCKTKVKVATSRPPCHGTLDPTKYYVCSSVRVWMLGGFIPQYDAVCCSVMQYVAVRCSVLQCVAVRCSVLQCVAMCCSVLQCVTVCCSVLQCVTVLWMRGGFIPQCEAVCDAL